jgi:hypothetical protein
MSTIKPNEKRSDDNLLRQFKEVMDMLVPLRPKGYVSGRDFDKQCQELFGISIRGALQNRFASAKGRSDGFNLVKAKLGYVVLRTYSEHEVLEIYKEVFNEKGKQPTENDIKKKVSMRTVYRHFGSHMKAIDAMRGALGLEGKGIYPKNIKLNPAQKVGEDVTRFNLGLIEAPVNEQGVVFVFAKTHGLLSFPIVERPQQEFPDCRTTCMRRGVLERVNIEFKFSCKGAFKKGRGIIKYKEKGINYLICWKNDSTKNTMEFARAGIEVIALKDELEKLLVEGKLNKQLNF